MYRALCLCYVLCATNKHYIWIWMKKIKHVAEVSLFMFNTFVSSGISVARSRDMPAYNNNRMSNKWRICCGNFSILRALNSGVFTRKTIRSISWNRCEQVLEVVHIALSQDGGVIPWVTISKKRIQLMKWTILIQWALKGRFKGIRECNHMEIREFNRISARFITIHHNFHTQFQFSFLLQPTKETPDLHQIGISMALNCESMFQLNYGCSRRFRISMTWSYAADVVWLHATLAKAYFRGLTNFFIMPYVRMRTSNLYNKKEMELYIRYSMRCDSRSGHLFK